MARDFNRQVAEFQVHAAVLNGYTALGISVTEVVGWVCPEMGAFQPSSDLCTRADRRQKLELIPGDDQIETPVLEQET